jgi:hypothetical protein
MAHPGFIAEFNRPSVYDRRLIATLKRLGFEVTRIVHKTAFLIRYRRASKFSQLCRALNAVLHVGLGGVLFFSKKTGRAWKISNRGNRPRVPVAV